MATFNPANFVHQINNSYFPLKPGTTFVYKSPDGSETVRTAVTHETKTLLGVNCIVVLDRSFVDGKLVERTRDCYAQDKDGNVWYFGEEARNCHEELNAKQIALYDSRVDEGRIGGVAAYEDAIVKTGDDSLVDDFASLLKIQARASTKQLSGPADGHRCAIGGSSRNSHPRMREIEAPNRTVDVDFPAAGKVGSISVDLRNKEGIGVNDQRVGTVAVSALPLMS